MAKLMSKYRADRAETASAARQLPVASGFATYCHSLTLHHTNDDNAQKLWREAIADQTGQSWAVIEVFQWGQDDEAATTENANSMEQRKPVEDAQALTYTQMLEHMAAFESQHDALAFHPDNPDGEAQSRHYYATLAHMDDLAFDTEGRIHRACNGHIVSEGVFNTYERQQLQKDWQAAGQIMPAPEGNSTNLDAIIGAPNRCDTNDRKVLQNAISSLQTANTLNTASDKIDKALDILRQMISFQQTKDQVFHLIVREYPAGFYADPKKRNCLDGTAGALLIDKLCNNTRTDLKKTKVPKEVSKPIRAKIGEIEIMASMIQLHILRHTTNIDNAALQQKAVNYEAKMLRKHIKKNGGRNADYQRALQRTLDPEPFDIPEALAGFSTELRRAAEHHKSRHKTAALDGPA